MKPYGRCSCVLVCVLGCTTCPTPLIHRGTAISINRSNRCIMEPSAEVISSCLNLMRRLPPKDIEKSLAGLLNLVPEATDELLQRVDQVCPALYKNTGAFYSCTPALTCQCMYCTFSIEGVFVSRQCLGIREGCILARLFVPLFTLCSSVSPLCIIRYRHRLMHDERTVSKNTGLLPFAESAKLLFAMRPL